MPVTTFSAAVHITPVVVKTFYKHARTKGRKLKDGDKSEDARDDIFFDEAFHIVKAFIELGTKNTIESLQAFTNTHVPAPYWAAVSPVQIPLSSCNKAADILIDWFGPDDLKTAVGGERWWQIRGLDGIDGEWITEKEFLNYDDIPDVGRKLDEDEKDILRMDHLETVMLYVHGGAYFWGSINTHRYQIIRYARKIKGRAFAVNYRKAPQYPWPCPMQDVLAAYMYLIEPPPHALHSPVPPSKIVLAGDSAGGGLCITLLTVLRDMGIRQPAGAVLISPWVDLTHSFPSVMKNTTTDIIPPHGFIHRPSTLWPVQTLPEGGRYRVIPTSTGPPPKPGHADTLRPSEDRLVDQFERRVEKSNDPSQPAHTIDLQDQQVGSQHEMLESNGDSSDHTARNLDAIPEPNEKLDAEYGAAWEFWEPKPPKVLMDDPNDTPLELRSQIQIYATTEQLTHPLVSPVLQGSLGNLCPLYILAGDGEVLRDEIIYLAHKAAHPREYPTWRGVLEEGRRQRENAEKFQTPTKVHLQVFDGMCHVLTVFMFTDSAKFAYRSIAEFVKHVTTNSEEHLARNPFPELHRPPSPVSDSSSEDVDNSDLSWRGRRHKKQAKTDSSRSNQIRKAVQDLPPSTSALDSARYEENRKVTEDEVARGEVDKLSNEHTAGPYSGSEHSQEQDVPGVVMIRERVDIYGRIRPMEPKEEVEALQVPTNEIGIIKEQPVRRWLSGQEIWDKKYHRSAVKVTKRKAHYEHKAEVLLEHARKQGLVLQKDKDKPQTMHRVGTIQRRSSTSSVGSIERNRRWGPFDLDGENPPPSAIAGRRDTKEAIALMKKTIYHTAPVTHRTVPRLSTADAIRAAFNPDEHPSKAPKQSVSEEQTKANIFPVHGVQMWQSIVSYFMHKSSKKATDGKNRAAKALRITSQKLRTGSSNEEQQQTDTRHSTSRRHSFAHLSHSSLHQSSQAEQ
ncbi:hypothetical protein ABKN59_005778 [Abortiporus biennis]